MKFVLLTISIFVFYSNLLVFKSSQIELILQNDTSNNEYSLTISEVNNVNSSYPSLASNSVPIKTYLSRYYSNIGDYSTSNILLLQSLKINANSLYSRYLISRNLIYTNQYDKSLGHLRELFHLSPKNNISSVLFFTLLSETNNHNELKEIFPIVSNIDDNIIWKYYVDSFNNSQIEITDPDFFYQLKNKKK